MPAIEAPTSYADLTPTELLDALDAVGFRGDGRVLQLNSYENRVFQVHLEESLDPQAAPPAVVVAKFYRAGRWSDAQILEEHAFARELAEAEVPAVAPLVLQAPPEAPATLTLQGRPPTLATLEGWRFAVSPRCGGRSPELEDASVLEWIGRFLGRLHTVGARRPFAQRLTLDGSAAARASVQWLIDGDRLPPDALHGWQDTCLRALDAVDTRLRRHGALELLRLHGDCHVGNLLWTSAGPHFVDLDDAVNGPAVQDLWMLLGGDRHEMQTQLGALLDGYETIREFDRRELALIEPLRLLRMMRHNAWVAQRWHDPAFPAAFPDFGSSGYWGQQALQLREQLRVAAETPSLATLL